MTKIKIRIIFTIILIIRSGDGYGGGAPESQCSSLAPGHGQSFQDIANSPFSIQVGAKQVKSGSSVPVKLRASSEKDTFKGFLLLAQDAISGDTIGYVTIRSGDEDKARYLDCAGAQSAATHINNDPKKSLILNWQSPEDYEGTVKFLVTFVKDYSTYWVKQPSENIEVGEQFAVPNLDSLDEPEAEPEPETEPETEPEPEVEDDDSKDETKPEAEAQSSNLEAYQGCDKEKSCFGYPANCHKEGKDCTILFSWAVRDDKIQWEGYKFGNSKGYVSVGISDDQSMGNDVIFACTEDGSVSQYDSIKGKTRPVLTQPQPSDLKLIQTTSQDGNLFCKFNSGLKLESGNLNFDLKTGKFFILLAEGGGSDGNLEYHVANRISSDESLELTSVRSLGASAADPILFRLHGFFMMFGWLFCAGTAILIARNFKPMLKPRRVFGKDIWFVIHSWLMFLNVVLNLIALILICIYTGAWPYTGQQISENPHQAIGIVVYILCFIQPLMAFFRPHPDSSKRWIFNYAHMFVGVCALNLAFVCLLLAPDLPIMAGIDRPAFIACMSVYIIIYALAQIVLGIQHSLQESRQKNAEIHPVSGNEMRLDQPDLSGQSSRVSKIRYGLLVIFLCMMVAVVIALACNIFLYESQ